MNKSKSNVWTTLRDQASEALENEKRKLHAMIAEIDHTQKTIEELSIIKADYHPDKFGGQLTIRAPKSKTPFLSDESSIEDKINFYLHSEINPALASHGGEVSLVEVLDDNKAVLQFGGGCQGCSMIDVTLKDGVEKTLIENVPEIETGNKDEEIFEESIYDSLLINNSTKRIDQIFTSYLIIGSDERNESSSASRGRAEGSRADVILIIAGVFITFGAFETAKKRPQYFGGLGRGGGGEHN